MKIRYLMNMCFIVPVLTLPLFGQTGGITHVGKLSKLSADSIAADTTGMGTLTSVELAKAMIPGWNVGNSLDAIGGETSWGNPMISQSLIDSIKAAGFHSVRIPVAWSSHFSDASTFTIDPAWLDRVEQVVSYVLDDGMFAIINEHYDGGWIQPTYAQQAYVNDRLAAMWRQIAIRFRDYGGHLLFAGMNEIHITDVYSGPTVENYTVQNSFNQTFVTTVRSTGGCNVYRYLAVQGYNTNIDYTYNYFAIPTDVTPNRLMVEVHYYDPYDFTLNTSSTITQWGKNATDPSKTETWANESYADGQFQKMKTKFIDKGYAVILGEYGPMARLTLGSDALNAEHARYRLYYMEYITRSLDRHGLVPIYWDNGYTGDTGEGIFDRSTGAQVYPDIIKAMIDTLITTTGGSTGVNILNVNPNPAIFFLNQNYPNPFNPSTKIAYALKRSGPVRLSVFDVLGREVGVLVHGVQTAGDHQVIFSGRDVTSGIYIYKLQADDEVQLKKMALVK
ncbi:MAG: cellulase family glycosylhydrolase [Ignavibacteriales bacterium]|nr:cellulase family glycosylhydrolase [Ignavibacteriales bacterium]